MMLTGTDWIPLPRQAKVKAIFWASCRIRTPCTRYSSLGYSIFCCRTWQHVSSHAVLIMESDFFAVVQTLEIVCQPLMPSGSAKKKKKKKEKHTKQTNSTCRRKPSSSLG